MSKKIIIAMAVMSFALCGVTFAAVENIKVSGDIGQQLIVRSFDLGGETGGTQDEENFLFSQVRVRFDADLTEGVSGVVRLINERIWDVEDESGQGDTEIELDLAYIELREMMYQPLTFRIGRQNLYYGNGLIIGDPDTNRIVANSPVATADLSLKKSFDAARAILDYAPYTIDLLYAVVNENATNLHDDISIAGGNISYDWSSYNGVTEGYVWYAATRGGAQVAENEDKTIVLGGRVQMDPTDKITLGLEGAYQMGDSTTGATTELDRDAFAVQFDSEYRFLNDYNAKIGLGYTYLSGDDDTSDNENNAWDPLFEDQSPAEIINILMANSNAQYITASASMMPKEDVTLGLVYTHARLAKDYTSTTLSGATASPLQAETYVVKTNEQHFGDEIDVYGIYDYTEDVQLKLNTAFFIPGDVFASNNDTTAYSVRAGVNLNF